MDYNDPSRRQYAQNTYATQQPQTSGPPESQYGTPGSSIERFRQTSYMQQSPTTVPSTGRASSDAQVYGFAQSSQYGSGGSAAAQTLQYAAELQSTADPRPQDTQHYQQYGPNAMYGITQQTPQAAQSPYEISRYSQRSGTAPETLASQFGVTQNAAQYYLAGQPLPSATAPELAAPQLHSQYQQSVYAGAAPSSSYASAIMDPTQSGAYSYAAAATTTQYSTGSAQSVDQAFTNYQHNIRTIFTHVREGTLRDLGSFLMDISHYLLGNAEPLGAGLTRDDDNLHDDRIRLWDEFNRAWLATLSKQVEMTQEWIRSGARDSPNILSQQALEHLSRELIRLCDSVEKHGLVDYQMGVAEEEIMDLLLHSLSLLDLDSTTAGAESSTSASARER